ncbi:MAG: FkbM family methyltransferase [Candidatus Omnitrophica bacterium]|nr:FkbM family methyltransferase [Candidatus Omnitrophota bacterium]
MHTIKKIFILLMQKDIRQIGMKICNKIKYLYTRLTFKPYVKSISICEEEFNIIISDLFAKSIYDNKSNLEQWEELKWLKYNCIQERDVIADCGANIGVTGLFFSRCVGPSGKVVGFEALPANADVARKNIQLNRANNFEIRNQAVGSFHGIVEFSVHPNGAVGVIEGYKNIKVPVVTLDESFPREKPTFLKIDVEGYELEVLRGAVKILAKNPKIDLELHCACFSDRIKFVESIIKILNIDKYLVYIQLERNKKIKFYHNRDITPELIAGYDNVHLFAMPRG